MSQVHTAVADGASGPRKLEDLLGELHDRVRDADETTVETVLEAFSGRVFGPVLAILGLLVITPVGAIPLVPTIVGTVVFLIAVQQVFGRRYPWIPRQLRERAVDADKVSNALEKVAPWARKVDKVLRPRLTFMIRDAMHYVVAAVVSLLALLMIPLELVPFAVFVPGLGVLMFGLAVTASDGLFAMVGFAIAIATLSLLALAL